MRSVGTWLVALVLTAGTGLVVADPPSAVRLDTVALDRRVKAVLEEHSDGIEASVWVGGPVGAPWYAWKADVPRPTASAIKTAYLVELFAAHAGKLDEPLPGVADVFKDEHPAIAHFPAEVRDEIRRALRGATVRRIGEVMIGKVKAGNAVYNAAANVTTAALGGPRALTEKIHARDSAFASIHARRYMLAARNVTGDNEATADSLAAGLQGLASRRVSNVDAKTVMAMRDVLLQPEKKDAGKHFVKHGALASDPLTQVRSGWWEFGGGSVVYVVMTAQPNPGTLARDQAAKRLAETANRLTEVVIGAAKELLPRSPAAPR